MNEYETNHFQVYTPMGGDSYAPSGPAFPFVKGDAPSRAAALAEATAYADQVGGAVALETASLKVVRPVQETRERTLRVTVRDARQLRRAVEQAFADRPAVRDALLTLLGVD